MGNIIRIKEGGLPKVFDAAKLRTNLQGGGNCLWIPKESYPVDSKFITENGTYLAAAEGLHGFSSLNVSSQPDYVVGNKGGKPYYVHKGGTAGNDLIYEELPTEIRVTKMPYKTIYTENGIIDYSGIEITAYKKNGEVWTNDRYKNGVIPIDELYFSNTHAKDLYGHYEFDEPITGDFNENVNESFKTSKDFYLELYADNSLYNNRPVKGRLQTSTTSGNNTVATGWYDRSINERFPNIHTTASKIIVASDNRENIVNYCKTVRKREVQFLDAQDKQWVTVYNYENYLPADDWTYNGKKVYYFGRERENIVTGPEYKIKESSGYNEQHVVPLGNVGNGRRIAWSLIYGERGCVIKWPRYPDHKILETFVPIEIEK